MTNAFNNANKLRAWTDPVALGADPTGAAASDAAFAKALATGLPLHLVGNFRLDRALAVVLAAGQDFVLQGAGPEAARLTFATGGLSVTYPGDGTGAGDGNTIRIEGIGIETNAAGTAEALRIVNTASSVVNDSEGNVSLSAVSFSGATGAAYWSTAIYLENVAFPDIREIRVEDGAKRTVALSIATTGSYAAVDTTIDSFKCWEVATAVKIRGRAEGVYLNHFIVIGGETGIDWQATVPSGAGKKPLLLLDNSHINVAGTAVKTVDVAQVIASDSLIYLTNRTDKAVCAFDFQATSGASSENSRINGVTIIGQGDRTGSLAVGVRCGANVFGVAVDATIDNVGTCVETVDVNRTTIAPGARLSNYNTRSVGMYSTGSAAGGVSGGVSVDGTLQIEASGADSYTRDMYREQIRARSFTFTASAASETIEFALPYPFRTDTSMVVACWGTDPGLPGATVYPDLPACTKDKLYFKTNGVTSGSPYRINYIAYGY